MFIRHFLTADFFLLRPMLDLNQLRIPENMNAPVLVGIGDQD
jgi:hypothetical protein